jgi:small ligand-binding sensory domain FIST
MKVGTGLAIGSEAQAELAAQAVANAMLAADTDHACSILLFLTAEFARAPLPALQAAARASRCTAIMGCSAPGIFTEQDWVIDAPAAAAMVFADGAGLQPVCGSAGGELLLALTAPNAIDIRWMDAPARRFGGVSGDATGQGPFSVWQHGRGVAGGYCEAKLGGVRGRVAAAHGLRLLDPPRRVAQARGYDLQRLDDDTALQALQQACACDESELPQHRLMAIYAETAEEIARGHYHLASLVGHDAQTGAVTVARPVEQGNFLCWGLREADAAIADLERSVDRLRDELAAQPRFGLLFSCLGRGPYFYGGVDRDLLLLKHKFPDMPLIGFYGNGEIAPRGDGSELLQYSAVLGLFTDD